MESNLVIEQVVWREVESPGSHGRSNAEVGIQTLYSGYLSTCSSGESPCSSERINKEIVPEARDASQDQPVGRHLFQPRSLICLPFMGESSGLEHSGQRASIPEQEEISRNRWESVTFLSSCVGEAQGCGI